MLGCTLGLHQCNVSYVVILNVSVSRCWTLVQVSAASVESSLWIVDSRGRVKYGNYQSQQSTSTSPGTRLEYAWVRHPLPHDVRSLSATSNSVITNYSNYSNNRARIIVFNIRIFSKTKYILFLSTSVSSRTSWLTPGQVKVR